LHADFSESGGFTNVQFTRPLQGNGVTISASSLNNIIWYVHALYLL